MKSNNENTTVKNGQTITFYSYKGGVGRSMTLVNIACLAAKEKKKVLLIDCDLEAPGLHQFFKAPDETPGFVDLVSDLTQWIKNDEQNDEEGYNKFMAANAAKYICSSVNPFAANNPNVNLNIPNESLPKNTDVDTSITIDLIKSGQLGTNYSKKLGQLNWMQLYEKAPAFFRTFAIWLETQYDYIFVDARTGLADTSGICTMLMPQKLVLVFVLNKQNINGVVDVARQAIEYRFDSNDCRRLDIYPLPSRIENSVNPYLQQWIDNYKVKFEKLFTEKYLLTQCSLSSYFDRSFIQYYAIHAYGENIPALYESITSSNFITYNYNNFYTVLKKNIPAWEVITLEEEQNKINQSNEHFRKGLDFYYKKEYEAALSEYNISITLNSDYAEAYVERGNCKHMLKNYNEAIEDYAMAINLKEDFWLAYSNRGLSKTEQFKYEEAIIDFNKAIILNQNDYNSFFGRGHIKVILKKYIEAIEDYSIGLKLNPKDVSGYIERAIAKFELKDFQPALEDVTNAIKLDENYSNAFNVRACIYRKLKQYDLAQLDNEKSLLLDNKNSDNWGTKAEIFSDLGNDEGFYEYIEKAIDLGLNIQKEIEDEPKLMNKYLHQSRFQELLKKYNIEQMIVSSTAAN